MRISVVARLVETCTSATGNPCFRNALAPFLGNQPSASLAESSLATQGVPVLAWPVPSGQATVAAPRGSQAVTSERMLPGSRRRPHHSRTSAIVQGFPGPSRDYILQHSGKRLLAVNVTATRSPGLVLVVTHTARGWTRAQVRQTRSTSWPAARPCPPQWKQARTISRSPAYQPPWMMRGREFDWMPIRKVLLGTIAHREGTFYTTQHGTE